MKHLLSLAVLLMASCSAIAQDKQFALGYKPPITLKAEVADSISRHKGRLVSLPRVTAPAWDCRTLGQVPPIVNQGPCGSCWDFAGSGIVTSAFLRAGYGKPDGSFAMSEQYFLDCPNNNGGCNGDWHATVLKWAKQKGLPTVADYGPYVAREGNCKDVAKYYQIADWGFCTPSNEDGVATTQEIKDCMVKYGPVAVALCADNAFSNMQPGTVFRGNNRNVNHAVILVGWDDAKAAWILRNSWGSSWCDGGYCWIGYGANAVGTAAAWCNATALPPPPVPPGPVPPGPLPPGPTPFSVKLTLDGALPAGSYQIVPADAVVAPAGSVILSPGTVKELQDLFKFKTLAEPPLLPKKSVEIERLNREIMEAAQKTIERFSTIEAKTSKLERQIEYPTKP